MIDIRTFVGLLSSLSAIIEIFSCGCTWFITIETIEDLSSLMIGFYKHTRENPGALCQNEGTHHIVMSPTVAGCLLKKWLTKGGHGHPRTPLATPLENPRRRCFGKYKDTGQFWVRGSVWKMEAVSFLENGSEKVLEQSNESKPNTKLVVVSRYLRHSAEIYIAPVNFMFWESCFS